MARAKTMNLNYLNDFYFLESLKAEITSMTALKPELEFKHSATKLREDIQETCNEMYPNMAYRIFVYLFAACLGEARHAARTYARDFYLTEITEQSRSDVFSKAKEFPPTKENVARLIEVFDQPWQGSFGGKAWKNIAKALKMYFDVPHSTFIDHVVDLQHNSGTVFSKDESKYHIDFEIKYHGGFTAFLDYKFSQNMLKKASYETLYVTGKVRRLLDRFKTIFHSVNVWWAEARLPQLQEYVVEWGTEKLTRTNKWAEWADCGKGNVPNLRWMLYKLQRGTAVYLMTRKQFKKHVCDIEKKGNKKMAFFGKKYQKEWALQVEKYYGEHKDSVKPEKQPVTYSKVPVKMKSLLHGEVEIQFLAPYFGYGTKTEYGFVYRGSGHGIHVLQKETVDGFDGSPGYTDGVLTLSQYGVVITTQGYNWNWEKQLEAILE